MTVFSGKAASMKPAPRGTQPRSKMVRVKVLDSERERIENLADLADLTMSAYVRAAALGDINADEKLARVPLENSRTQGPVIRVRMSQKEFEEAKRFAEQRKMAVTRYIRQRALGLLNFYDTSWVKETVQNLDLLVDGTDSTD